jgi:hypothetical protein
MGGMRNIKMFLKEIAVDLMELVQDRDNLGPPECDTESADNINFSFKGNTERILI